MQKEIDVSGDGRIKFRLYYDENTDRIIFEAIHGHNVFSMYSHYHLKQLRDLLNEAYPINDNSN